MKLITFLGLSICPKAWRVYYGISEYTYYEMRKSVKRDELPNVIHKNKDRDYEAKMREMCCSWFGSLRDEIAENLPTGAKLELMQRVIFL